MPARVCFTLDNLGDAADLYRGVIQAPRPAGHNPPLETGFPALLSLLHDFSITATYFVEGWSARQYPQALESILRHGHTIGMHGWQHEKWQSLTVSEAQVLSERATEAFREQLGRAPEIFRAPGGYSNDESRRILAGLGYRIDASLAQSPAPVLHDSGLALVPYQWEGVDATHWLWDKKDHDAVYDTWVSALENAIAQDRHFVFIWHPHVMGIDAGRLATGRKILDYVCRNPALQLTTLSALGHTVLCSGDSPPHV